MGHGRAEANVQYSIGRLEGNRLLERPRYRWEDNIKVHQEIGSESVDCIQLASGQALLDTVDPVSFFGLRRKQGISLPTERLPYNILKKHSTL